MQTHDLGKLAVLLVAIICGTVLLVTGTIDSAAGVGLIMACVGYVTGNGVNALRKQAPSPVLVPRFPVEADAPPAPVLEDDHHGWPA